MIAHGHEDLTRQMATLLAAVQLILKVYGRGTVLGEELGELDDGGEAAMTVYGKWVKLTMAILLSAYPVSPSAMIGRM